MRYAVHFTMRSLADVVQHTPVIATQQRMYAVCDGPAPQHGKPLGYVYTPVCAS